MNYTAKEIANILRGTVEGDETVIISSVSKIEEGKDGDLCFLSNSKYNSYLYSCKASIIIVNNNLQLEDKVDSTLIRVENSYLAFSQLLNIYNRTSSNKSGISKKSHISDSTEIGKDCYIAPFVFIGDNVIIGNNVQIHPHCFIGDNVIVKNNTTLFSGVKIYNNCEIGEENFIHAGAIIGSDGFGFNLDKNGNQIKVIHNGNVILEDNVEIGANCTIDKATLGSTIIKTGVKIDNLVQVAHNVIIGENTVIAACVGIAGSTTIGKNCMIGGQAGVSGHLIIGDRVMIQAQSGVMKSVDSDSTVMGMPAINYRDYNKSYVHFKNLPSIIKSLDKLFNLNKDG